MYIGNNVCVMRYAFEEESQKLKKIISDHDDKSSAEIYIIPAYYSSW